MALIPWLVPAGLFLDIIGAILVWIYSDIWHDEGTRRWSQFGAFLLVVGFALQLVGALFQEGGPLSAQSPLGIANKWVLQPFEQIYQWFLAGGWMGLSVAVVAGVAALIAFLGHISLRPRLQLGTLHLAEERVQTEGWDGFTHRIQGGDPVPQVLVSGGLEVTNQGESPVEEVRIRMWSSNGDPNVHSEGLGPGFDVAEREQREIPLRFSLYSGQGVDNFRTTITILVLGRDAWPGIEHVELLREEGELSFEASEERLSLYEFARIRLALALQRVEVLLWFSPREFSQKERVFDELKRYRG